MQSRAWPPQQTRRSALFQQTTPTPPTRPPKPWPPARPRPSQRHPPSAPRRDTATGRDSQPAALGGSARDSEGPLSPSVADSRPANRAWACRSAHSKQEPEFRALALRLGLGPDRRRLHAPSSQGKDSQQRGRHCAGRAASDFHLELVSAIMRLLATAFT